MTVDSPTDQVDDFTHGEGRQNGTDAQAADLAQEKKGHGRCDPQADDVERNLDFGVGDPGDIRELSGKEVGGDDRHFTAVRQGDAQTDNQVADDKVEDAQRQGLGQLDDPEFVDVDHDAENKAHHETQQVLGDEFFSENHEA